MEGRAERFCEEGKTLYSNLLLQEIFLSSFLFILLSLEALRS